MSRAQLRAATFGDIPSLAELIQETHEASRIKGLTLDLRATKALLLNAVQRNGTTTFVKVAEQPGGGLEGFILGVTQPLYHVLEELEAQDLFWIARPGAHAWTAARLLRSFHKWALAQDKVAMIRQGVTNVVDDASRDAAHRLLQRAGMNGAGAIYEKERPSVGTV